MIGILAALGLFAVAWNRVRLTDELPLLGVAGLTLLTFCTWPFFHDRFLVPLLPLAIVWAGAGLDRLRLWGRDTAAALKLGAKGGSMLTGCLLSACFVVLCSASAVGTRRSDELSQSWSSLADDVPVGQWLGQWLDGQARSTRLMDTGPTVAYYSGAAHIPDPWTDGPTALRYIDQMQIAYLIFRDTDRERRPYLTEWLQHVPDRRLELLETFQGNSGIVRVYRWRSDRAAQMNQKP
jgi:hypothetical protein